MTKTFRLWTLGAILLGAAGFWGCATPAVVFISPDYATQAVGRVSLLGFSDFPGQEGSGAMTADIFEKYLFNLHYLLVDPNQARQVPQPQTSSSALDPAALAALHKTLGVDAVVTGSLSAWTDTSEETVMVDIPQEETEQVYRNVVVQRPNGRPAAVTRTGVRTVYSDQMVPQAETLPARVGLSVRMVGVKNGEVLWTGSATADGLTLSSAAEAAAAKVTAALQKALAGRLPSPTP